MIPFSYLLDFSNFTNLIDQKICFKKFGKVKIIKVPEGFIVMTYRFVVDAPNHWATCLVTNLGKKKLWNHTRFISTGSTSLHGGVPYTTLCKSFCLHFGFKLNFNSCLGFLYHFSFADHSVYALSIHSLFHLPLVSVCSMLSDGWESSMFQGL